VRACLHPYTTRLWLWPWRCAARARTRPRGSVRRSQPPRSPRRAPKYHWHHCRPGGPAGPKPTAVGGAAAASTSLGWGREGRSERGVGRQDASAAAVHRLMALAEASCNIHTHIYTYMYKYISIYVSGGLLRRQQHPFIRESNSACWHVGAGACVGGCACVYTCVCVRVSACPAPSLVPRVFLLWEVCQWLASCLFVCLARGFRFAPQATYSTCEFSTMSNDPTGSENGCPCPAVGWYLRVPRRPL
jgi:hypothetical protein